MNNNSEALNQVGLLLTRPAPERQNTLRFEYPLTIGKNASQPVKLDREATLGDRRDPYSVLINRLLRPDNCSPKGPLRRPKTARDLLVINEQLRLHSRAPSDVPLRLKKNQLG